MRNTRRKLVRSVKQQVDSLRGFGVTAIPRATPRQLPMPVSVKVPLASKLEQLKQLRAAALACTRCPLHKTRTNIVISDGSPDAKLVFVGEAPGRDEDLQGVPFVGRAGQLLTKMIEAMGLKREQVYICNVLKDRPPENRTPLPEEMEACLPFLEEQLRIIQPKVICVLGSVAAKALIGPHVSIMRIRGQLHEYQGIPLIPTFHPAYLLRNPPAKKEAWEDLKQVMKLLKEDAQ